MFGRSWAQRAAGLAQEEFKQNRLKYPADQRLYLGPRAKTKIGLQREKSRNFKNSDWNGEIIKRIENNQC